MRPNFRDPFFIVGVLFGVATFWLLITDDGSRWFYAALLGLLFCGFMAGRRRRG